QPFPRLIGVAAFADANSPRSRSAKAKGQSPAPSSPPRPVLQSGSLHQLAVARFAFQFAAPLPSKATPSPPKKLSSSAATTSGLFSGIKCPESTMMTLDRGIRAEARRANVSGMAAP